MKLSRTLFALASLCFTSSVALAATCQQMGIGQGASLNGFLPFLASDSWREPVTSLPVASNSASVISQIGSSRVHPDFGANDGDTTYGIPYNVVSGIAGVNINYQAYGSESDPGPMPVPASTLLEGGDDRHALVLDRDNCFLYELYNAHVQGDGSWNADSGAVWDLLNNNDRPYGWTSADAAGLPIFPGLARYDEVAAGVINHALRFTLQHTSPKMIAPATHYAGNTSNPAAPPMGTRFRLKASYDISGFTPQAKVILQALKTYGMILADNGSNLYISGTSDNRWDNDDLHNLGKVPPSAFEVVSTGTAVTNSVVSTGKAPVITALKASAATVASGKGVKLVWTATDASYYLLGPVGAIRGTSVSVYPTKTTTYTLYATNHYGRTSKTITISVH